MALKLKDTWPTSPTAHTRTRSRAVSTGVHNFSVMPESTDIILLVGSNYYADLGNGEHILVELGPHVGWDELSRVEDWEECPF